MAEKIRFGVVGAGNITRNRHIPNLLKLPDVEVVAVANRTLVSAQKVATDFNIADASDDWRTVVQRDDIDAVLIGAPPYVHLDVVSAAIDSGKDVLSETRMSTTLADARQMLQKVRDGGRKAALVRPSRYIIGSRYVKELLSGGFVGEVRQVFCYRLIPDYTDATAPITNRQDFDMYGELNCLYLGYCWDVLHDWFGNPKRVLAHGLNFTPQRPSGPEGPLVTVRAAEAVTAIAEMEGGANVTSVQTGLAHFGETGSRSTARREPSSTRRTAIGSSAAAAATRSSRLWTCRTSSRTPGPSSVTSSTCCAATSRRCSSALRTASTTWSTWPPAIARRGTAAGSIYRCLSCVLRRPACLPAPESA